MPPPQCPECGRFLATAFVETIRSEPAPCPGCGTELSLEEERGEATAPEESPPVPPPAAALPDEEAAGAADALDAADDEDDESLAGVATSEPAATEAPDGEEPAEDDAAVDLPATPAPAATLPEDVEPEADASVRPPDQAPAEQRDPLEGWDRTATAPVGGDEPDPTVLAAGAGVGLVLGLLLGGRDHRGLGALLGAALGAAVARLRGL